MPRITTAPYDPADIRVYDQALERNGSGSTTHDVCEGCCPAEGDEWPEDLDLYSGEPRHIDLIVEVGVMHPPYEDDDYTCALCGALLTEEDD